MKTRFLWTAFVPLLLTLYGAASHAAGALKLQTPAVLIDTGEGEATLNVRNDDSEPVLMITRVEPVPEDSQNLVLVAPPIARVEPGQTQLVRFLLKPLPANAPGLKTEHYMRASFEGVPTKKNNTVSVSIEQNIPVVVHPAGLDKSDTPWQGLRWHRAAGGLRVENPSPYVVRLMQALTLLPSQTAATLPRTYILPGESLAVSLKTMPPGDTQVRLRPASLYGFVLPAYEAPLASADTGAPAQ